MQENLYSAIGRLVAEPECNMVEISEGVKKRVANFTLAIDEVPGKDSAAVFIDCTAWGASADFLNSYIKKGDQVYIRGRLRQERWETESGGKRSKIVCVVEKLQG